MDNGQPTISPRERVINVLQRLRLRRREPWNWLVQTVGLALLPFGVLFHSAAFTTMALLAVLAGCLRLGLPPMAFTGLRRLAPFIETRIGRENAWLARPMDNKKRRKIVLTVGGVMCTLLLLWEQDLGPIGLAIAIWALWRVRRANIDQGIDP